MTGATNHPTGSGYALKAMTFARRKHATQLRKYTGEPYFSHLSAVAGIVAAAAPAGVDLETAVAVAFLHDIVEDQGITEAELLEHFTPLIAYGVMLLSDLESGNRTQRKAAGRARLAAAPGWVQTIKCADLISNTASITRNDPKFAVLYLEEKRQLLEVMTKADRHLHALALSYADGSLQS